MDEEVDESLDHSRSPASACPDGVARPPARVPLCPVLSWKIDAKITGRAAVPSFGCAAGPEPDLFWLRRADDSMTRYRMTK